MMKIRAFSLYVFCLFGAAAPSFAEEAPVCHRCEEIREYNAKYHENFEYYDDYVKKDDKEVIVKPDVSSKQKSNAQPQLSPLPSAQSSPLKK
jgi:hypothetical protein